MNNTKTLNLKLLNGIQLLQVLLFAPVLPIVTSKKKRLIMLFELNARDVLTHELFDN